MWIHHGCWNVRRIASAFVALSYLGMSACGGSSDEDQGGDAVAEEGPKVFTADKAGQACSANADCGNGYCAKQFESNSFLGGGSQPAPGGYCTFDCKLDADCGQDGLCIGATSGGSFGFGNVGGRTQSAAGKCMLRCDSSSQCREGYRCLSGYGQAIESGGAMAAANASGACQVAPETDMLEPGVVGTMCAADGDCGGGQCMTETQGTTFPGGYCTGRCLANGDCGAGAECVAGLAGAAGTCYSVCEADADCGREGYRCRPNGLAQQGGSKLCYPGAEPLADGIVGSACTADADCGGQAMSCYMMNGDRPLPGGYCTLACVEDIDCGVGGVCVGFGGGTGYCYKTCGAATDCREGYSCEMIGFGGMAMNMGASQTVCTLPEDMGTSDQDAGVP